MNVFFAREMQRFAAGGTARPSIDCSVKVGFLGDMSVGKTSTLRRMLEHRFFEDPLATVGVDFF